MSGRGELDLPPERVEQGRQRGHELARPDHSDQLAMDGVQQLCRRIDRLGSAEEGGLG